MPSPSLLLHHHHHRLSPRFAPSRSPSPRTLSLHPAPRLRLRLRLRASARGGGGSTRDHDDGARSIPIARCYEAALARLDLSGTARREQAVAAAAAADGGAAAEAHLAAVADAMVMEAFLPGPDGARRSAMSTRLILQANEVTEKASKLKKDLGTEFFSENEPDAESVLAMAFKQVVMDQLTNFRLEVFSPGSEIDLQDLSKPRKVPADFSIRSSDEKLLAALAEAIFSCVIEDARNNYLGGTGGLFHKWKSNCSLDSSVCIDIISESEVVNSARRRLDSFDLVQSSHVAGKAKNGWWPAPKSERLVKIGGPDFMLWASEFVYTYKLQIDAKAFKNTKLGGHHVLANNKGEVLLSHAQMVELANILDMYFEDQFTLPGKTFYSNWNSEPSKIKKNNGYLNNLFALLAGSSIVFLVGAIAQLCWPQSLKDKRLATVSSCVSSSQSYCSDIHSLDSSELQAYCVSVVEKIKDSFGCTGDLMVDANIGAWVGELPEFFKGINCDSHDDYVDIQSTGAISQGEQPSLVSSPIKMSSHLEQNDDTQETLQNIASFQVVMSERGKVVGFQPTNRLAVNHWATNPLTKLLYEGRKISPAFLEPRLRISRPAKVVPVELLMSVNPESFFALVRPVQDPC
ncbi:uncharacterized protein [Oryza sativa Japonica Group]|uniref:Os02g0109900 protein n=4 Tax=Oryza TaxID=4527 RepID=A0A0P0VDV1_ORYSJ|nr:uncharacterized protein LOC4328038 isoform X1 [Oryza sativa Japonica Group]XP_015622792.1 uncharacterized protein LOC4328038 isoform X1 [Oryza sativa Japonica Group]XP_015622793.1 uncharacterized protein LOC4328038 isoform X1 [Oryza sativa Japonica Group]XP_015622794.1 uncharacterized protein LOC4328038 isoform X1 [Oryza sativa Japonica Group]XP_015622796.1 uncharacterized protein LOC4328038 isoform X1 [Oryza sativa Japonica Group]EAY84155.1 hypothetical protein OsI_05535 [Oryza sativa Indi